MNVESHAKTRFTERTTPLLTNPHKGCATFQRFNGDPLNEGLRWSEEGPLSFPDATADVADRYLPCTVAYCRWFWEVFEPEEGRFDWSVVEGALATARARGQTLQVRLMPHGSQGQPQLPAWYQARYPTQEGGKKKDRRYIEAIYDGPEYLEAWTRVIAEFGERFDGHPDLEAVDLAYIGPWGEGAGDVSQAQVERFVAAYVEAHPRTPLLSNIDGYQLEAGMRHDMGWRCDCFGDLGFFGRKWNHTYDYYPMAVCKAGAQDRWQARPVTMETCGVPASWKEHGFDLDFILRQGYKFHTSVLMPKSNPIPEDYMEPLAGFCDRIGYRLVLRQATWARKVKRGDRLDATLWIENTGVAPLYWPYELALRLRCGDREAVLPTGVDARAWQPGDAWIEQRLRLPGDWPEGETRLAAGLVRPGPAGSMGGGPGNGSDATRAHARSEGEAVKAAVRFAVDEAADDGWVPLGKVTVE